MNASTIIWFIANIHEVQKREVWTDDVGDLFERKIQHAWVTFFAHCCQKKIKFISYYKLQ